MSNLACCYGGLGKACEEIHAAENKQVGKDQKQVKVRESQRGKETNILKGLLLRMRRRFGQAEEDKFKVVENLFKCDSSSW